MKNKENGITLIALIITIIVMLILVGVTINVALNGGLFDTASDAKVKTQKEADREELVSSVYATVDNRGNLQIEDELGNNLPQGWSLEQSSNANYLICISAKGTILYVNKETGTILDELPQVEPVEPVIPEDVWYNINFKDLSQVNLPSVFPGPSEGNDKAYSVGFTSKTGVYGVINVITDRTDGVLVMLVPDIMGNACYSYEINGGTQEVTPWTYVLGGEEVEENPSTIQNVQIDYTAASITGADENFTEAMLSSIVTITEAE